MFMNTKKESLYSLQMQSNFDMGRYIDDIKDAEEQIKDVLSANPDRESTKKGDLFNATTLDQKYLYTERTRKLKAKNEIKIINRGQRTSYIIQIQLNLMQFSVLISMVKLPFRNY